MRHKNIRLGLFGEFCLRVANMSIAVPSDATEEEIAGLARTLGELADQSPEALWSLDDGQYLMAGHAEELRVAIEKGIGDTEEVDYRFVRQNGKLVLEDWNEEGDDKSPLG